MRIVYITPDARGIAEKTKLTTKLIEEPDGYHPVSPEAIWLDDERRDEPLMMIYSGIINPLGSKLNCAAIWKIENECETVKKARRKQSISRMWVRALVRILEGIEQYGIILIVVFVLAYSIITNLIGG